MVNNSSCSIAVPSWPEDAPSPLEDKIMSIICGNSHLHWAIHSGKKDSFAPTLFWRTPPLHKDERQDDPCAVLARHLPQQAHALVFGTKEAPPTKTSANHVSAKRRVPALSVYVISTNQEHESALLFLFREIPCRLFRLSAPDFFTKEQGCYEGMGVDRVAALLAAKTLYSTPVIVFDAGTALTYTAMDRRGKIMGGGISPGVAARFRSMSDYCGNLPVIEFDDYNPKVQEAMKNKTPLPTFAKDTPMAMMSAVFTEIASHTKRIVNQYLKAVNSPEPPTGAEKAPTEGEAKAKEGVDKPSEETAKEGEAKEKEGEAKEGDKPQEESKESDRPADGGKAKEAEEKPSDAKPTVAITGGDSLLLNHLLKEGPTSFIEPDPGASLPRDEFELVSLKHLVHHGVGHLLTKKSPTVSDDPNDEIRTKIWGLRIAKRFQVSEPGADPVFRGSVISVKKGATLEEDVYQIRYDDGDGEQMDLKSIYDGLKLYHEKGEKLEIINAEAWVGEKKKLASESAKTLFEKSTDLQKKVEEEEKRIAEAKANGLDPDEVLRPDDSSVAGRKRGQSTPNAGATKKARTGTTPGSSKRGRKKQDKKTMYLNRRIAKAFQQEDENGKLVDEIFYGTIDKLVHESEPVFWHVQYDDDDEEEFDESDVKAAIRLYAIHEKDDPRKSNAAGATEGTVNTAGEDETRDAAAAAPVPAAETTTNGSTDMQTDDNDTSNNNNKSTTDAPAPTPAPATGAATGTTGNGDAMDVDTPSAAAPVATGTPVTGAVTTTITAEKDTTTTTTTTTVDKPSSNESSEKQTTS